MFEPFTGVIDAMLRADIMIKASVIYERLVAEHGFAHNYQRVKIYVRENRDRIAAELDAGDENSLRGLHRRFETVPGAQAQVDWGDEGPLLAHVGIPRVYSFHMVLSYSRDPFCVFTTSMDLVTFWDCHRRAFAHFGGVPGAIVYDRAKTVIRRSGRGGRCRCTRRRPRSPPTTGSTSTLWPSTAPTGKPRVRIAAANGRLEHQLRPYLRQAY